MNYPSPNVDLEDLDPLESKTPVVKHVNENHEVLLGDDEISEDESDDEE